MSGLCFLVGPGEGWLCGQQLLPRQWWGFWGGPGEKAKGGVRELVKALVSQSRIPLSVPCPAVPLIGFEPLTSLAWLEELGLGGQEGQSRHGLQTEWGRGYHWCSGVICLSSLLT